MLLYTVQKNKTNVKGYWKDKAGKVYVDNILVKDIKDIDLFDKNVRQLFGQGEKAVFYRDNDQGIVLYPNGKRDILKNRITRAKKTITKQLINELLNDNGGITIFKNERHYLIETFT